MVMTAQPPAISGFPSCCGMRIFNGFPYDENAHTDGYMDRDEIREWLKTEVDRHSNSAMLILSLNQQQYRYLNDTILEGGFKRVASGRNTSHGNMIYLYVWERPEPKKDKMASRKFGQ